MVVENAWSKNVRGSKFSKLCKKHGATQKALRSWYKEVFGHCQSRINDLLQKSRMSKVRILLSTWVELRPVFKLNYLSGLFVVKVFRDRSQGSSGSRQEIKTHLSFTCQPLSRGDITILMLSKPMMGLGSMVPKISNSSSLTNSESSSRKKKWIS